MSYFVSRTRRFQQVALVALCACLTAAISFPPSIMLSAVAVSRGIVRCG